MPTRTSARTALPPALVVLAAACALLTTAVALAGPAAAIEDPRRPTAEVTHGPSCGPAVVRVAVTNGTVAHRVALVFDGDSEQDDAVLADAEQAELTSTDVDWGQTVDVSVTVTAEDGTAEDPLELGTYTRPSAEDCAVVPPSPTGPEEPTTPPATSSPGTTSASAPSSSNPAPAPPTTTRPTAPRPSSSAPAPAPAPDNPRSTPPASTSSGSSGGTSGGQAGSASAASVSPGGVVTVRATGFVPGEAVTVSLLGVDDPLSTVTAGGDGSVEAVVQIPRGAALGTATVQLVGADSSAVAGLDLQVAAREVPVAERTTSVPVLTAGIALIAAAAALGLLAARRSRGTRTRTPR